MSDWTDFRDTLEIGAVLAGNFYYPGSSIVTSRLVSDNAREFLDSKEGRGAQVITGGSGIYNGNLANWTGGSSSVGEGEPISSSEPAGQSGSGMRRAISDPLDNIGSQQFPQQQEQQPQKDANADRRRELMERAAELRQQIADLRQQIATSESVQQTTGTTA